MTLVGERERTVVDFGEQLTGAELSKHLRELGVNEDVILRATMNAVGLRAEACSAQNNFAKAVNGFAKTYGLIGRKLPTEEQLQTFSMSAEKVLVTAADYQGLLPRAQKFAMPNQFVPPERYTHSAATVYVCGKLAAGQIRDPQDEEKLAVFLNSAPVEPSAVLHAIGKAYVRCGAITERPSTLVEMGELWDSTNAQAWSGIMEESAQLVYDELQSGRGANGFAQANMQRM